MTEPSKSWPIEEEDSEEDPLHAVTASEIGERRDDLDDMEHPGLSRAARGGPRVVLDPMINLTVTSMAGIRQLLGRRAEPRPKPLLRIVCKGCGLSSFDPDVFLPDTDYLEWLGNTVRWRHDYVHIV